VFELTLEQGYRVTTMLAVAAVAVLLAAAFYYRAFGTLRRRHWQTLLALRILAILIVVLLLFRPVFSYHRDLTERPGLIFLLDRSGSMSIADDATGVTRFNQAREQIDAWWGQLDDDFNLVLIEFSEEARSLEDRSALAGLMPDGKATSLSRGLSAAAQRLPRADVEAVILLSDGVHNSAGRPDDVARKLGVPVHTVGVGATLKSDVSYRDVRLTGMDCPDRLMLNNKARITASVDAVGLAGRAVAVVLERDGQQIDQVELTLDEVEGDQEVAFEFLPTVEGRHTYTVRALPLAEEKIVENNERSAVALVVERGIRVLYLEGTLREEYGALTQRFLSRDPDLEFYALVQTKPNHFLKRTNIAGLDLGAIPADAETIGQFDVFILGDLDSSYLRPDQQELIVNRIRDGAGLIMLGGYRSLGPGGYGQTPLGAVLPVLLGDREIGQVTDPFLPKLTPDGARHPIFANIADYFPTRDAGPKTAGLPDLLGGTRVGPARPGATVLATCPVEPDDMPVLAVQPVGEGRTAVFACDTTRRWQQGLRARDEETPFLQFWGQLVRWLAGRTTEVATEAGVSARTDKGYYEPGETVGVSAIVRDQEGEGTGQAVVTARVRGPAGRTEIVPLAVVPGPAGHYGGTFEPGAAGTYEIAVEAELDAIRLAAEPVAVEVGRPNLEFENLDLDEKMLARIAANTGGRCMHISTAAHLIDQLDRTARKRRLYMEKPLFWPPAYWALFAGLLTTEWILRRRFQLR